MLRWLKNYIQEPAKTRRGWVLKILSLPVISALALATVVLMAVAFLLALPILALVELADELL